jgi:hypothetical protein
MQPNIAVNWNKDSNQRNENANLTVLASHHFCSTNHFYPPPGAADNRAADAAA